MLSVSLLTTITKNCAGQWLGQTRVDYVCVRVLTLHRCVHALRVSVCVRVLYMRVCCLSCSIEGLWNISGGRWGCVCVPTTVLRSGRGEKEVKSMASEGWLAGWQQQTASAQ